jgi:hypothetical protein
VAVTMLPHTASTVHRSLRTACSTHAQATAVQQVCHRLELYAVITMVPASQPAMHGPKLALEMYSQVTCYDNSVDRSYGCFFSK